MAAWGYQLNEDDSFCEVVESFRRKLCSYHSMEKIVEDIRTEYGGGIDDHIVRLAIAECLWRVDALTKDDILYVKSVIDSEIDASYWAGLDVDDVFLRNRSKELHHFFDRISNPPEPCQMWGNLQVQQQLQKGTIFWYKSKGNIYGAVVLEVVRDNDPYYLIAISEGLGGIPVHSLEITQAQVFTVAWFGTENLLNAKRMHILEVIDIKRNYQGRYGLRLGDDRSFSLTNCGQSFTWSHAYRAISFHDRTIKDFL